MKLKPAAHFRAAFILLTLLAIATSIAVLWNTVRLQEEIEDRTLRYVSDVSSQLTTDIHNRLLKITSDLASMCDSIQQLQQYGENAVYSFLTHKAELHNFTSLAIIRPDGQVFETGHELTDPLSLSGVQASLAGESGVSFIGEQSIFYTIPIYADSQVVAVLGGVRNKANMQQLIRSQSFSGKGLTCIIDQKGSVVISPTDLAPFLQLDSLFVKDSDSELTQHIIQMEKDMPAGKSGTFRFRAVDGSDLILSYDPLGSYGWVLLTLVPSNVISLTIDNYIHQTFFIVGGVVLLMVFIVLALFLLQRSYYRQMEKAAFCDRLTGGMNNAAFQLHCEQALLNAQPGSCCAALLNIKNFKLINERFTSQRGDQVLQCIMEIISERTRSCGFAARADADNFFLFLHEGSPDNINALIADIQDRAWRAVKHINPEDGVPYRFVLQPGVYIIDDPGLEITVIQDRAKTACRSRLPSEDGVCKYYDAAITRRLAHEQELNGLFETSLENHDFQVYFQPKVFVKDGSVGGAEALVRWIHPQRGTIYPSDFIPLFENNGNICRLDLYIFEEVCRLLRRRLDCGFFPLPVSVNLSRQHFRRSDCLKPFADIAQRYEIPRGLIELELTESILFDDQSIEQMKQHIRDMHSFGFLCSLDDFGSGYSSLGLLMEFDVDVIKLDRRFFTDVSREKTREVIRSVIELSHTIGAVTVAEGIETMEQLNFIREAGCDLVQGYIYAKPMPAPMFEQWLNSPPSPQQ